MTAEEGHEEREVKTLTSLFDFYFKLHNSNGNIHSFCIGLQ